MAGPLSQLETKLVPKMTCESHFTRFIYRENVSVPVDMKFIAKIQREDDRLNGIHKQFPERFQVEKIDSELILNHK